MITYHSLNKFTEIAHFCTTRQGGVSVGNYASYNLSPFSGDHPAHATSNKNKLAEHLHISSDQIILPYQTHGTEIREIDENFLLLTKEEKTQYLEGVDALFTKTPKLCIAITTADCVPLLFFDPTTQVIAAAHAGWRGTCARIAEKTIQTLIEKFNCKAENIHVVIGPSISSEVYEVGKEVVDEFEKANFDCTEFVIEKENTFHLDLWKANQRSLKKAGILEQHIETAGICTYTEHDRFFSARRLGIKSGRLLSGIMLK